MPSRTVSTQGFEHSMPTFRRYVHSSVVVLRRWKRPHLQRSAYKGNLHGGPAVRADTKYPRVIAFSDHLAGTSRMFHGRLVDTGEVLQDALKSLLITVLDKISNFSLTMSWSCL